jgi:hypothetical protein
MSGMATLRRQGVESAFTFLAMLAKVIDSSLTNSRLRAQWNKNQRKPYRPCQLVSILQGQRIGYVRVSSYDQNPERQLGNRGGKLFTDKASGKDTQRPSWKPCSASSAKAIPWWCTAWIAWRATSMICAAGAEADPARRAHRVLEGGPGVHRRGLADGQPRVLSVMGAFAEFERALIRERQREGIALAKQRGRTGASSPTIKPSHCGSGPLPASRRLSLHASSASAVKPSTSTFARTTEPPRRSILSATERDTCLRCRKARMT